VRTALRVHPSVVAARRSAEAAFQRVRAAEGARLPQVSVDAAAAYRDAKQTGATPVEHRFQSFGFDVSWVLFDFGELAAFARQAAEQWMAAQQDARSAEVDQAFAVRTAYFELDKNRSLGVARATIAQFQARLDQVTELEKVGKRIPYDVTKAKVDLGNAELAEITTRNAVATSRATLVTTVGLAGGGQWCPIRRRRRPRVVRAETSTPPGPRRCPRARASRPRPRARARRPRWRRAAALRAVRRLRRGQGRLKPPLPWSLDFGPGIRWTPFDGFQNLAAIESVATLRERAPPSRASSSSPGSACAPPGSPSRTPRSGSRSPISWSAARGELRPRAGPVRRGRRHLHRPVRREPGPRLGPGRRIRARADRAIAYARLARAVGLTARQP
jgi:outer membrane protein TolC